MSYAGIQNENEFFTSHYLSEIFPNDIKEVVSKWQEKSNADKNWQMPNKALRALAKEYFQFLDEFRKKKYETADRIVFARNFYQTLLNAFEFDYKFSLKSFENGCVPILAELIKENGATHAWVIEAYSLEAEDNLSLKIDKNQYVEVDEKLFDKNFEEIINSEIFTLDEAPRWVLLVSPFQLLLIDRHKWAQKRFIEIDLEEVLGRREDDTIKAVATLCHSDSLLPKEGESVLDRLDENSHKHAFGVTEDLKFALRESIELLANEAILFSSQQKPDFLATPNLDAQLTRESLRYMYRLLFLFFIESRPELNYVPMKSDPYLKGYSIENLRDIELAPLLTENDKNGFFFHESISLLFDMIFHGRKDEDELVKGIRASEERAFTIIELPSHLFAPSSTPILNSVKIRNHIWQKIICLMSLSRPGNGRQGRGRISYTNLGINQLGAVYEALLSYKGFIARETLYEVKKKGENPSPLDNAYFVNENQLKEYTVDERVFDKDKKQVSYPAGSFIYRLAGRDREKSASYYTPEVLTQCVVKYALKGLLEGKKADDILKLTVCEPAMGSAAFLNEAINQLSEAYLQKKQEELNERIAHDKYLLELQKVKMYIADNNVFGVDLNPTAVELAEVSLWLNALFTEVDEQSGYRSTYIPWFGFQLMTGNSLIGARRQVYHKNLLEPGQAARLLWLEDAPKRLEPKHLWSAKKNKDKTGVDDEARPVQLNLLGETKPQKPIQKTLSEAIKEEKFAGRDKDEIYHFLLGDKGMADYNDKIIKGLRKDQLEEISRWRNSFTQPYQATEIKSLQRLSESIDKIWVEFTAHQSEMRKKTTDPLLVWGQKPGKKKKSALGYKDSVLKSERFSEGVQNSSLYSRLKLVMDYWCALWFWPIDEADKLPSRHEFLADISLLVEKKEAAFTHLLENKELFASTMDEDLQKAQLDEFGFIDVNAMIETNPRLQIVKQLADKNHFLHWELEFADIFAENEGFDLILGNPPWLKVEWNEGGIMGEANPLFDLRKFSAAKLDKLREDTFRQYSYLEKDYLIEYESAAATKNFLNAYQNYSDLKGMQTNLYKCFLPQSWMLGSKKAHIGFLHPEGPYDDPKGGRFREGIYPRLNHHLQFVNELLLFPEVDHHVKFSINTYSGEKKKTIGFDQISNLYGVNTVEICYNHNGEGSVGGIKDENNNWNLNGHKNRIVKVNKDVLKLFAKLYDSSTTPFNQARLPAIHAKELISVLEKFAKYPHRLSDLQGEYISTVMWDETNAQKNGTMKRETRFAKTPEELILSGPHFFVGNPCYKTPRRVCTLNSDYDTLDLTILPDDYLPRTNYVPACSRSEYSRRTPNVPWQLETEDGNKIQPQITEYYRLAARGMISQSGERSLITTMLPPMVAHNNAVRTYALSEETFYSFVSFTISTISLPYDFILKSTGRGNLHSTLDDFPVLDFEKVFPRAKLLFAKLISLTKFFSDFWNKTHLEKIFKHSWAKNDNRLGKSRLNENGQVWHRDYALRSDYERRQALVEVDVLVAIELGMTLEELCAIYRIQFPVLRQNENDTWYDQKGRIVFTVSKGLPGVGLDRPSWEKESKLVKLAASDIRVFNNDGSPVNQDKFKTIKEMQAGYVERIVEDDTIPDYRKAYCELVMADGSILQCPCPDYPTPIEGPVKRVIRYYAPFDKCDREEDYKTAWEFFTNENNK